MTNYVYADFDTIMLKKRILIEPVIKERKTQTQLQHTRHRSFVNFQVNIVRAIQFSSFSGHFREGRDSEIAPTEDRPEHQVRITGQLNGSVNIVDALVCLYLFREETLVEPAGTSGDQGGTVFSRTLNLFPKSR